ncbi:hypothetical protein GGC03_25145 (plasmid) [Vibrio sp. THAF191c]|nr:hypothetical protein FIU99_25560 [Vibrio sp. THAF64]QGM37736.1 hypothetical protein GGC04_25920 [Vibrio sp. THAF191d]QGN73079.1 hypothetical protein GGC03_25145 [Vibrio sp. THAF191c]
MITTLDEVQTIVIGLISLYIIIWSLPAAIVLATVSLGDFKYIITIDKYLAKDLGKYYDKNGFMRPDYQMSYSIGSRFIGYCIKYPFIHHRARNQSTKFRLFMWANTVGTWGWLGTLVLLLL